MDENYRKIVLVHWFVKNKLYSKHTMLHVPRKGDEVRLYKNKIFIVKRIIWIFDEESSITSRANIELDELTEKGGEEE
jgi:hypothetical protein